MFIIKPNTEWLFIDDSTVKAHQHSMGDRGHKDEASSRSCGSNSTKIYLEVNSYGLLNRFY